MSFFGMKENGTKKPKGSFMKTKGSLRFLGGLPTKAKDIVFRFIIIEYIVA
jgi:hypothetical protein